MLAATFVRLIAAALLAFAGMTTLRYRPTRIWRAVSLMATAALWLASIWIVRTAIPYPRDYELPSLSIVASSVFIAALAADELIGGDLRRYFKL